MSFRDFNVLPISSAENNNKKVLEQISKLLKFYRIIIWSVLLILPKTSSSSVLSTLVSNALKILDMKTIIQMYPTNPRKILNVFDPVAG